MKNLFTAILPFLFAINAHAALQGAPFIPEVDARFDALERAGSAYPGTPQVGTAAQPVARGVYSFATQGGAQSTPIYLGVTLPANSLITRDYLHVTSSLVGGGASIEIYCNNTAAHSLLSTISDATLTVNSLHDADSTGASAAFVGLETQACPVTLLITGAPLTAGQLEFFANFVVVK